MLKRTVGANSTRSAGSSTLTSDEVRGYRGSRRVEATIACRVVVGTRLRRMRRS